MDFTNIVSPSSSCEVKSGCYSVFTLVNTVKKLVTIVKATCLCSLANRVDHERIRDVGPDRAASEWLLRCGAVVRYHGQERWQKDYNHLPTGPLDKYKIQAIDATDSCIMSIGFDHMEGLQHVEKIRLCKCHYIEDDCLERLSQLGNLQKSMLEMEIISCGNVTDKGIIALHHLRNLKYLFLSDLPGIKEKEKIVQAFKTSLPSLELKLDLK
ncbi:ATP synthase subunit s, mitochondrial isoform X1 [Monodon monoceros]|uniref:ATP synthase subunit s, mitochondrial isoform X1 n=1 Tax=Monodon monoceros TaxID=40151 RepID=UPI0010F9B2DA|nr:ATP synthase subunit s, mitochondrial isoform X1 [Monodon monoceros]XP_029092764.1 ATP synthase subunit s, mitochondrial isoform X1 [Monodon monoceros]